MAQVLSQEEVDALLRGVSDGDIDTETDEGGDESGVVSYDLTSQERIIRGRMPTLDIINQRFARLFRNSLSTSLRKVFDVNTISTDTVKFGEFIKSLPVPTSMHIFKMEPLRGFALMIAESKLVFALVDTFFGGTGASVMKVEGRDFTTIEQRMIKKVIMMALADIEKSWNPVHSIDVSFVRSEVNPQFALIVPPTDVVVAILFEVEMDNLTGTITVCLPYSTIEPVIGKLKAGFQSTQLEVDQEWLLRLRSRMNDAQVDLSVELGNTIIDSREMINLKVGDIIQLNKDVSDAMLVKVEGIPKFWGHAGAVKGSKAVQISSIITRGGGN